MVVNTWTSTKCGVQVTVEFCFFQIKVGLSRVHAGLVETEKRDFRNQPISI